MRSRHHLVSCGSRWTKMEETQSSLLPGAGIIVLPVLNIIAPGVPSFGLCNSYWLALRFSNPPLTLRVTSLICLVLRSSDCYWVTRLTIWSPTFWTTFYGNDWCGLRYQKYSTKISVQAWCEGSREGKWVQAGRQSLCHAYQVTLNWVRSSWANKKPTIQWGVWQDLRWLFGREDLFPSVTYSSWNKRLRQRNSSCIPLFPWMDLYTVLGVIQS